MIHVQCMAGARHALTLRSKSQRSVTGLSSALPARVCRSVRLHVFLVTYIDRAGSLAHRVRRRPSRSTVVTSCPLRPSIRWRTRWSCCLDAGHSTRRGSRSSRTGRCIVPAGRRSASTTLEPPRRSPLSTSRCFHPLSRQQQQQQQMETPSDLSHPPNNFSSVYIRTTLYRLIQIHLHTKYWNKSLQ